VPLHFLAKRTEIAVAFCERSRAWCGDGAADPRRLDRTYRARSCRAVRSRGDRCAADALRLWPTTTRGAEALAACAHGSALTVQKGLAASHIPSTAANSIAWCGARLVAHLHRLPRCGRERGDGLRGSWSAARARAWCRPSAYATLRHDFRKQKAYANRRSLFAIGRKLARYCCPVGRVHVLGVARE